MHNFQIGDEVRISIQGRMRYKNAPGNPHHAIGRLVGIGVGTGHSLYVHWDNGEENSYCVGELERIELIVENE